MDEIIAAVHRNKAEFDEPIQPPATEQAIKALAAKAKLEFDAVVPSDFEDFLRLANGIAFDGIVIYGSDQSPENLGPAEFWHGLSAANHAWRDGTTRGPGLILGETDMDLFVVDQFGHNPALVDKVSDDVFEEYESVTAGIETILKNRL